MLTANFVIGELSAYILVFCRIGGMIFFNPLLARRNLPTTARVGLAVGITIVIAPSLTVQPLQNFTDLLFLWAMVKELAVGFACGLLFELYYYMLFAAGDIIDMGFGLAMSKAFDPGSNIQASFSGKLFQLLFGLYFFATNSHLVFIYLMKSSYDLVGIGAVSFGENVGRFFMTMFSSVFLLAMQLALPFVAASFILEMAMGLLMKLIPQINVFSISFQLMVLLGLFLLFLLAEPTSIFLREYITNMFGNMQSLLGVI